MDLHFSDEVVEGKIFNIVKGKSDTALEAIELTLRSRVMKATSVVSDSLAGFISYERSDIASFISSGISSSVI